MFIWILRVSSWGIPAMCGVSHGPIFSFYWNCSLKRWFKFYSDCYCIKCKSTVKWVKLYCLDPTLQNSRYVKSRRSVINQRRTNRRWWYTIPYYCSICGCAHPTCSLLSVFKNQPWLLENHKSISNWNSSLYEQYFGILLQIFASEVGTDSTGIMDDSLVISKFNRKAPLWTHRLFVLLGIFWW